MAGKGATMENLDERRRHPRTTARLSATVWTHGQVFKYRARDLSAGGVALFGTPELRIGQQCELLLQLQDGTELRADAEVRHHVVAPGGQRHMGVEFANPDADLEDRIQSVLLAQLERATAPEPAAPELTPG
jgi:c-di-GMP-binding flagellar brake protein YcgR